MKHTDLKQKSKIKYYWYLSDPAPEFMPCDNCEVEAPLYKFESWNLTENWLCEICSNVAPKENYKEIAAVANIALTMLGKFDDVDVQLASDYSERFTD